MSTPDRIGQEMEQWSAAVRDGCSKVEVPELDMFLLVNLAAIGAMRVVETCNKDAGVRRGAKWGGLRDVASFCRGAARRSGGIGERDVGTMAAALAVEIIQTRYGKYVGGIDAAGEDQDDE